MASWIDSCFADGLGAGMQPLSGVLVLDFTTLPPGPLATLLLAEARAQGVKIQRPGGEGMRHYRPRFARGSLPAVMNVLLALRQRDQTGEGCYLDIAMTDAMFTFAGHALASGHATGQFPGMGGARLSGGSLRYQIYPTRDGKFVCCAALEQKFWNAFTAAIKLDPKSADDGNDPMATKAAVAAIVAGKTADQW